MEKIFEQLDFSYENELFEKRNDIQEDCVQFEVYTNEDLDATFLDLMTKIASYFEHYIWNFSPLQLRKKSTHIEGCLQFGDLYDEAWLIVKFILAYTKENSSVSCRIIDSDGEFLLIESADYVPDWLQPGNDHGRVWLAHGQIYLIPLKIKNPLPTLPDKLSNYRASKALEECITKRAAITPNSLNHTSRIILNEKAAAIISAKPQLISPIIQAFYTRDPGDLKPCTLMTDFPRSPSLDTSIKFNRCHLAQLLSQKFVPHRKSGYLPAPLNDDPNYLAFSLGAKLATGLQILLAEGFGFTEYLKSTY